MVSLQTKLNLKVTQRQILTPGLVQMVSVLALNKLELKDMINEEMVENPVLDEYLDTVPTIDEIAAREEQRERESAATVAEEPKTTPEERDPFEEVDFGSFFKDYLDPGYRSNSELESIEKPSFENFLSKPATLTDHLMWQLGAVHVKDDVLAAAELIIGNLNDDGYLLASDEELLEQGAGWLSAMEGDAALGKLPDAAAAVAANGDTGEHSELRKPEHACKPLFGREALHEALELVRQMDPVGVGARDLRECLMAQLKDLARVHEERGGEPDMPELLEDAITIADKHLHMLQNRQIREIGRAIGKSMERVDRCVALIRTLDPKPGLRYNIPETRLIEPDVAIIKQGDEYLAVMNDDDMPQLRLNPTYKKLLSREGNEKEVRTYVKERYKSAIQLIKNIEQRKQTILRVCYAIIGRQREFLDFGIDYLKPMMIKEVAEEIEVHPSTVSRAVASKYAHTPQGVFELRYFFSECVNGPEGGATSLLILKRRVKKLIVDEDPSRPLTDEQITRILQSQGIQVTRRTVAKYREDMKIPSTHQRRLKR
ncbi:MAG: RNA polymerase factor sigma-54 [Candidatus Korobacteraceae bacterium]|jgi:RNA polymerase sigma-54 factor